VHKLFVSITDLTHLIENLFPRGI